jgi:hypothetical protein
MNKYTLRPHPSLFPLRMILFTAELETPARPPHAPRDADELLAIALIERIRRPQSVSFASVQIEPAQPVRSESNFELVSVHA